MDSAYEKLFYGVIMFLVLGLIAIIATRDCKNAWFWVGVGLICISSMIFTYAWGHYNGTQSNLKSNLPTI